MPTKNPRIHITLDEANNALLDQLAKKQHKSTAGIAKELVLEALARHEDLALSSIADKRDTPNAKRITHKDAWK